MEQEKMFGTLPIGKLLTKMSVPIIIEMVVQSLYNIVDSLFVARLGLNALTAIGLAYPVQMVMIALTVGIGAGLNSLVSQRMGSGDMRGAGKAAGNAITLSILCYVITLLFGIFGVKPFFAMSTDNAEVMEYGVSYLSICCIASFGQFLSIAGQRMLQVAGNPKWSMITHLTGCLFNIVFDPILIFGLCGFPAMGVTGAAIATVGGQIVTTIFVYIMCIAKKKGIAFRLRDLCPSKDIGAICKVGVPAAAAQGISSVMSFGMNQILKYEAVGLAVFTAYYKLYSIVGTPVIGLLQGTVPIVGYNYGAGKKDRVKSAIKRSILAGMVMMVFFTAVFQIFPKPLIMLFDNGENGSQFLEAGVHALRTISWIFVIYAFGQIASNIFQAMGNGVLSLIYALLHQCVLLLPAAWLFLKWWGVDAVWYAYWFAEVVSVAVVAVLFKVYYKKYLGDGENGQAVPALTAHRN